MKKMLVLGAALALSGVAAAHPVNLRFETRGACEQKQAEVNNYDRDFVAEQVFGIEQNGEAQVFFLESFQCEYEEATDMWKMVNHMYDDADIGAAFDE